MLSGFPGTEYIQNHKHKDKVSNKTHYWAHITEMGSQRP